MFVGELVREWEIGLKVTFDGWWEMEIVPYFGLIIGLGRRLCDSNFLDFLIWL